MRSHATLLCLFAFLAGCSGDTEEPQAASSWGPTDPALASKFQAALEAARAEQQLPGLAMAVAYRRSRELWVSATGFSNLDTQTPWLPDNESRIGSVTKTFTTAIIMQLAEEGSLSLDDTIEAWVPGWYSGPTLRQLLGHTSGIASYNYVADFDMSKPWTPEQLVDWAYQHEPNLKFTPGTAWEYSNTNYVLLGMVIEKVTGQSYADALETRLFQPLDLDMRLASSGDESAELVRCYTGSPAEDYSDAADPSMGWAAGAIVSPPSDLARWIITLYGGELLSSASLTAMTTPNGVTPPDQEDFGLGTFIENGSEHTVVGHTGGIGGYLTYAYFLEGDEVALILMSNQLPTDMRVASSHGWAAVLGVTLP